MEFWCVAAGNGAAFGKRKFGRLRGCGAREVRLFQGLSGGHVKLFVWAGGGCRGVTSGRNDW